MVYLDHSVLCAAGTVCDERHVVFKCTAVQHLREQHVCLLAQQTQTMISFLWQPRQKLVAKFLIEALRLFHA
jgi:hypothetical protein